MHDDVVARDQSPDEEEGLIRANQNSMEMADLSTKPIANPKGSSHARYTDSEDHADASASRQIVNDGDEVPLAERAQPTEYRVYKIRWFGLTQLILLNIVVSWDVSKSMGLISVEKICRVLATDILPQWLSFSAVANTAADFYFTNPSVINWLSTGFLFAFLAAAPATIWTLHTGGPRLAIITSSLLILLGNWIRYAGTRTSPPSFALTMFGQILIGLAQPFVLSAPTHYSNLWFTPAGRVSATAIASLANPFGGALGQLINPFLATQPSDIPNMTLYVALISTIASIPSFFIPAKPPTPVSASSTHTAPSLRHTIHLLGTNPTFYLLFIPFAIYVGFFNSISSLLTQILSPYNYSEEASGIAGAVLILVGLLSAAITSPIMDRTKAYLRFIRISVPIIALSYFAFIWAPGSRTIAAPYIILAILGAANFSLVPVALEWLVEVTWPVGPEAGSTICWAGGQLFGGIFIVVSDALKEGEDADPPFTMNKALIFQAVVAAAVVPCAFALGRWGRVGNKRLDVDKGRWIGEGVG